jgi:hypothetical protein
MPLLWWHFGFGRSAMNLFAYSRPTIHAVQLRREQYNNNILQYLLIQRLTRRIAISAAREKIDHEQALTKSIEQIAATPGSIFFKRIFISPQSIPTIWRYYWNENQKLNPMCLLWNWAITCRCVWLSLRWTFLLKICVSFMKHFQVVLMFLFNVR